MNYGLDVLTSSSSACFARCRQEYDFRYEKGIVPDGASAKPLRQGDVGHVALQHLFDGADDDTLNRVIWDHAHSIRDPEQLSYDFEIEVYTMVALIWGYKWRWQDSVLNQAVLYANEGQFAIPLKPPYATRRQQQWEVAGKRDKIVEINGRHLLLEHKFLSDDLDDETFWLHKQIDSQVSFYWWSAKMQGLKLDACVYDVIRKPDLKPLKATPPEKRKYKKDGTLYANQREHDQTPEEYSRRLLDDIAKRPERYYQRREITRSTQDIVEHHNDMWNTTRAINDARRYGRFFKNTSNCIIRGRRCPYLRLCADKPIHLNEVPQGFTRREWRHPELEEFDDSTSTTTDAPSSEDQTQSGPTAEGGGQEANEAQEPSEACVERSGGVGQDHSGVPF